MNSLINFIVSTTGRLVRAAAGIALILVGVLVVQGTGGWVIAAVGLVPLATGAFDLCLLGPLAGLPIAGSQIRQHTR